MAQAPARPLLNPPNDEIIRKVREMSIEKILNFSLICEEFKEMVKSIQIKGTSIRVSIENDITIFITTDSCNLQLHYYKQPNKYWRMGAYGRKKKLLTPRIVEVNVFDNDGQRVSGSILAHRDWALKDWLEHLQSIFNYHAIDSIRFYESSTDFDIDDMREVFGNKSNIEMLFLRFNAYEQLMFEKFFPVEKLSIEKSSFQDLKIPESILIQNFDSLRIKGAIFNDKVITLDELLMISSKSIEIDGSRVSPKDFNKFLKLWQQGSNPHMECLMTSYEAAEEVHNPFEEPEEDHNAEEQEEVHRTIMRGIKHDVIPDTRERKFKSVGLTDLYTVSGGMDIYRRDGTKATIKFEYVHILRIFYYEMHVWHDHCVIE